MEVRRGLWRMPNNYWRMNGRRTPHGYQMKSTFKAIVSILLQ